MERLKAINKKLVTILEIQLIDHFNYSGGAEIAVRQAELVIVADRIQRFLNSQPR
jgi:hypothetical protein